MDSIKGDASPGKSGVGVLDKSVAVMAFLAAGGPASLAEVVSGTGLARPTAYRLLSALEAHHLISRRDGRYGLGLRLLGWGNVAAGGVMERARPALERLRDGTGESAQLYVREGEGRVCVASVERTGGGLRDAVPVGVMLPLERGSGGTVLLAWNGREEGEFAEVRARGWAGSVAEREEGVASVSAPVFRGDGTVRAAVSASGPISRLGESPGERLAKDVVAAAREIERALGE